MRARTRSEVSSPSTTQPGPGREGGRSGKRSSISASRRKAVRTRISRRVDGAGAPAHARSSPPSWATTVLRSRAITSATSRVAGEVELARAACGSLEHADEDDDQGGQRDEDGEEVDRDHPFPL